MIAQRWFGPGAGGPGQPPLSANLPRTALPVHFDGPRHLPAHVERLARGAGALGQPVPWLEGVRAELAAWVQAQLKADSPAALRLVLDPFQGILEARLEPLPSAVEPYRLIRLAHPLSSRRQDPLLVHKGLAGTWSSSVLALAQAQGAADALLCWPDGTVGETAIAAIALELGRELVLPPLEGRVASLAERLDLPAWATARALQITHGPLPFEAIFEGRLWCLNAVRGIWPGTLL